MNRTFIVLVAAIALASIFTAVDIAGKPADGRGWAKRWTCTETDSGIDFSVVGSVTWWNHTFADRCIGNRTLKEYYCTGNHFWHTFKRCDCVDGACISPGTCVAGYRKAGCEGNASQRVYVYKNCTQDVRNETCEFGCRNGKCMDVECEETPLKNATCDGNWTMRLFKTENCTEEWRNTTLCDAGCLEGKCIVQPKDCLPRYTDSYKCDGNWTFRLYRKADCEEKWMRGHFCRYGCVEGQCNPAF